MTATSQPHLARGLFQERQYRRAGEAFLEAAEATGKEREDGERGHQNVDSRQQQVSLYSNASLAFLLAHSSGDDEIKNEKEEDRKKDTLVNDEDGSCGDQTPDLEDGKRGSTSSTCLERALSCANLCVSLDPSWSKGYFRRAEVQVRLGDFETALQDYEASMARLKKDKNAEKDRSVIDSKMKKVEEALETLNNLQKAKDDLVQMKEDAKGKKEADKSAEDLTRAAEERDRDPEAKLALERASKQMAEGQTDACLASLRHVLRVEPSCFQASLQCGMILASKGDSEGALEYFQKTLQSQPGCLSAYVMMSQVLQQMKRYEEAEQLLKQVVGFAFDHPEVWSALAMILYKQGKLQEGVEILKYALTGGPYGKFKKPSKDSMVLFCLAFFMAGMGYLAEPCSIFMKICQSDSSPTTLYMMAQMCRLVNDETLSSQALLSLCKAYEMSPLAFCTELVVFNSTFDLPQWTDLASSQDIFRCLKQNDEESNVLQTYLIPEESKDLADDLERAEEKGLWIVRGETPKTTKVVPKESLMLEGLFHLKRGLIQRYVKPPFLIKNCKFSLHFLVCITSYFPLQISYNTNCYTVLSSRSDVEDMLEGDKAQESAETDETILSFNELENIFTEKGIDCKALWANMKEKITSAMLTLTQEVLKVKQQARTKRFSELGLSKILSVEFVLDQNLQPWLVNVDRTPTLKSVSNKVFTETILGAVVHSLGKQMFENSLGDVVQSSTLPLKDQVLYRSYMNKKDQYQVLSIDY